MNKNIIMQDIISQLKSFLILFNFIKTIISFPKEKFKLCIQNMLIHLKTN